MQSFPFCLSVQLDTIKFKVPAANNPPVQKVDNGGKNGQWILTINTLPPTFCTHQLAICQRVESLSKVFA